jgi:hypothetical protein
VRGAWNAGVFAGGPRALNRVGPANVDKLSSLNVRWSFMAVSVSDLD